MTDDTRSEKRVFQVTVHSTDARIDTEFIRRVIADAVWYKIGDVIVEVRANDHGADDLESIGDRVREYETAAWASSLEYYTKRTYATQARRFFRWLTDDYVFPGHDS